VKASPSCTGTEAPFSSVFDMNGNVEEWIDSCAVIGSNRLCRAFGGDYKGEASAWECRAGSAWPFDAPLPTVGFRCCL